MKNIDVGQTITVLANIGVIVGIAFLAVEIHQSTSVQESQMRFNQNERSTETVEEVLRNPELRTALLKRKNAEPRSPEEELLLEYYALRIFSSIHWIHGEIRRGRMPSDVLDVVQTALSTGPGLSGEDRSFYSDYWRLADKSQFDAEFVRWMEVILDLEDDE